MSGTYSMLPPRLTRVILASAVLFVGVGLLGGCITSETRADVRATQGVVLPSPTEEVWAAVRATLPGAPSAGTPMSLRSEVSGATVEVRVQQHTSGGTILDVTSNDPAVAERVQLAIQRTLMAR